MFKSIVPELISLDTKLNSLKGFVMCQNFNFYQDTSKKNKFHYTLIEKRDISIPRDFDFRSEYYLKKDNFWYYERKFLFWNPKLQYDINSKTLYFNKDYLTFPIKIGGMFTVGEHLSNLIDLDLFLHGYICLRGVAYQKNNKNICVSAPGLNGKTTHLKNVLKTGASYIAEDYLILNLKEQLVYPSCPLATEYFWRNRKIDNELAVLVNKNSIIKQPVQIDEMYFVENSQNNKFIYPKRNMIDTLLLNSLYFIDNLFIKSIIYDLGYGKKIFSMINNAETLLRTSKFTAIHNYKYSFKD